MEVIEFEPESTNPYQFVYNNPLIYSDPTGMFTITELNGTINMHSTLLRVHAKEFAVDFVKEKVGEVTGNLLNGVINRLLPTTTMGEHFNSIVDTVKGGDKFEKYITGQVCGLFHNVLGSYADRLWIEPSIHPETGVPNGNGISCGQRISTKGKGKLDWPKGRGVKPDFLIKNGEPKDYSPKNKDAYLIGDIKITLERAIEYVDSNHKQWQGMYKHANKYQILPFTTFITFRKFFGNSSYNSQTMETKIKQLNLKTLKKGVVLFLVSIFD